MSQFLLQCNSLCHCTGLEMSQEALKGVQRMVLKASLALALADLSFLHGAKGEVSCSSAESPGVSLGLMSWGQMKAGSDLHLSLL